MARHANIPEWLWVFSWFCTILLENTTKQYKPGSEKTQCYTVPHVKQHKRGQGKLADQAKQGIFLGYGHQKAYSLCLILNPKTRRYAKVQYDQITFHRDYFPYRDPKGQKRQPLSLDIQEFPDEQTVPDEGETMCNQDIEPLITSEVRTRARAAAEAAAKNDPPAGSEATSVQGSANAQIQEQQQAEQVEAGASAGAWPATDEERLRRG
eukprot:1768846-Rhodomonas_salina.2